MLYYLISRKKQQMTPLTSTSPCRNPLILLAFLSIAARGAVGAQITCMSGAVVKKTKSGQQYCDCSAVMEKDVLAGKLCEHRETQFCVYGGAGASTDALCTNGGTCKTITINQNQGHPGCNCIDNFWGPHCEYSQYDLFSASDKNANGVSKGSTKTTGNPGGEGAAIFAALAFFIIVVAFLVKKRVDLKRKRSEIPEAVTIAAELDPDGSSTMQGATLVTTKDMENIINDCSSKTPSINYSAFDDNDGILGPPTIEEVINRNAFDDNDGILGYPTEEEFHRHKAYNFDGHVDEEVVTFDIKNNDSMNSPPIVKNSFVIDSEDGSPQDKDKNYQEVDEEQPCSMPARQKLTFDDDIPISPAGLISPKDSIASPTRAVASPVSAYSSANVHTPSALPESPSPNEIV